MASSKSCFLLVCALLAFVLIVSAEASTSYVESEQTDEVEDYGGSVHPEGENPATSKGQRGGCKHGCCYYHHHHCRRCCKSPRELLDAQFEDDTGN